MGIILLFLYLLIRELEINRLCIVNVDYYYI